MIKSLIPSAMLMGAALIGSPCIAQDTMPSGQPAQTSPAAPANPDQAQPPMNPAQPQGAAAVKVSDTIYDPAGNPVGTIQAVQGPNAVLSTGNVTVQIPVSAISRGAKGPTISITKAEVEAQAKKDHAASLERDVKKWEPVFHLKSRDNKQL